MATLTSALFSVCFYLTITPTPHLSLAPASEVSIAQTLGNKMIPHDPIEDDPRYTAVIAAVKQQVREEFQNHECFGRQGFCHILWGRTRELLLDEHGIVWRSPKEMNDLDDPYRMNMID